MEKSFANFANYRLSANVLFSVDKDRAIALIRENIIRKILYLALSRKFSSAKISRYTVHHGLRKQYMYGELFVIVSIQRCTSQGPLC